MLFGNENAEKDGLVLTCYISNETEEDYQIITGRWGIGKTAYLFNKSRCLMEGLSNIDSSKKRLWYLDEEELNTDQVIDAYSQLTERKFDRYLKNIWIAEIYRRAALMLATLHPQYDKVKGSHWDLIKQLSGAESIGTTIWKQLPNALKVLKAIDDSQAHAVEGIQVEFKRLFEKKTIDSIQNCLEDIVGHQYMPHVVIEPLDTPFSTLDAYNSMAQSVIGALLNVFQSEFQPGEGQHLKVYISIPWHRFSNAKINLPQKITQYIGRLSWSQDMLRKFINARIEWEFKRVKRQFSTKGDTDGWGELFDDYVKNEYCQPTVFENSFQYVLRHTSYRPREVQRIARMAVNICADKTMRSTDYIIKGVGGIKVNGSHIKEAVFLYTKKATQDLITESARRYHDMQKIFLQIKGMSMPFKTDDLVLRINLDQNIFTVLDVLWKSEMIGVQVACKDIAKTKDYLQILPPQNCKRDCVGNKELIRWYFFNYNCDQEIVELLSQHQNNEALEACLIFHPRIIESITGGVGKEWPYGI